jgi:hypothetical protein
VVTDSWPFVANTAARPCPPDPAAGAQRRVITAAGSTGTPVVSVRDLVVTYRRHRGADGDGVQALRGLSLEIFSGETVGVVGESGAGKTTLGRVEPPQRCLGDVPPAVELLAPILPRRVITDRFRPPRAGPAPRRRVDSGSPQPSSAASSARAALSVPASAVCAFLPRTYCGDHLGR